MTVTDDAGATASATQSLSVEADGDCGDAPEFRRWKLYYPGDRVAYEGAIWEADWYVWGVAPSEDSRRWTKVREC